MTTPIHAIRALRWNYRWSGVWMVLSARKITVPGHGVYGPGWWLVLRHPGLVADWQHAVAEGAVL